VTGANLPSMLTESTGKGSANSRPHPPGIACAACRANQPSLELARRKGPRLEMALKLLAAEIGEASTRPCGTFKRLTKANAEAADGHRVLDCSRGINGKANRF
jgi:hypothetical protein